MFSPISNTNTNKAASEKDTPAVIPEEVTIFKKKTTPAIPPSNVSSLYSTGDVIMECSDFGPSACVVELAGMSVAKFDQIG